MAANESTNNQGLSNVCDGALIYGNTLERSDPFGTEGNGTAKFIGTGAKFDFHTIKSTNTIPSKRSIRLELPKNELLRMLCCLEGELQARDVVIAALRNDRVKHLIHTIRHRTIPLDDPHAALFRDQIASVGNLVSRQSSTTAIQADVEVRAIIDEQMENLCQVVTKQRQTQVRMVKVLAESLEKNQRMRHELEEEKRKHEHDTAQGDDITYGLEMERTKLKQELETERNSRKKLEKDLKKLQETLDFERGRQKQIVLLLLAERKKIIMKYIEERKRSEDLAQILSEEKQRSDSIAEGLEEESKKSLRMEAELEKQTLAIENERKAMKINLAKEEKRIKDLEMELVQLRSENEAFRKQTVPLRMSSSHNVTVPVLPAKVRTAPDDVAAVAPSSIMNVAKVVQPTATVSSVPVSGPTTGIARSISPGQNLRQQAAVSSSETPGSGPTSYNAPPAKVIPRKLSNTTTSGSGIIQSTVAAAAAAVATASPLPLDTFGTVDMQCATSAVNTLTATTASTVSMVSGGIGRVPIVSNPTIIGQPTTILRSLSSASATSSLSCVSSSSITTGLSSTVTPQVGSVTTTGAGVTSGSGAGGGSNTSGGGVVTSGTGGGRGVPPPIPPNKPVVPPKREPSASRLGSIAANNITNTSS